MLCRTSLSLVRFCSRGSAFKPVTFKHKISKTDFEAAQDGRSRNEAKGVRPKQSGDGDSFAGPVPVIKAPVSNTQTVTDQISTPRKPQKYGFDSDSRTEEENSDKSYFGSQAFIDNESGDEERLPKYSDGSQADRKGRDSFAEFSKFSYENFWSRNERRNMKSNRAGNSHDYKNNRDAQERINDDAFEIQESVLRDYGEKEHVYGIHPVLLALKAGRREIYRVYCKEGLEVSNPLVVEIHKRCIDRGIEFQSLDGKVFKRVFGKGIVHQGVFCFAGNLPVDVFNIGQLDETQNDSSASSTTIATQYQDGSTCLGNDLEDSSSDTGHTLTGESNSPELCVSERSSSSTELRSSLCRKNPKLPRKSLWVVLDHVVDPMNVGAVLRSCVYFGVSRVLMTPSCAELSPVVSKASSGAAELLHFSMLPRPSEQLVQLQASGWQVVAAAPQVGATAPQVAAAAPQVVAAAPQVATTAPQVGATAPLVDATAPQVATTTPQVGATAPLVDATAPQVATTTPQVVAAAPLVDAAAPQVAATASQVVATEPQELPHAMGLQDPTDGASPTAEEPSPDAAVDLPAHYEDGQSTVRRRDEGHPHPGGEQEPHTDGTETRRPQRFVPVRDFVFDRDTILVVGNEAAGISASVAAVADAIVTVSSVHHDGQVVDDSDMPCLNVSTATAIILHAITAAADRS